MGNQPTATSESWTDQAFLGELHIEAEYSLAAAADIDAAIMGGQLGSAYRALHSTLSHGAIISKILWPASGGPMGLMCRLRLRLMPVRNGGRFHTCLPLAV